MQRQFKPLQIFGTRLISQAFGILCASLLLAASGNADSQIRDVSPTTQKSEYTFECPSGAKAFGATPPQGHEVWCAKPPTKPNEKILYHGPRILWYANGQKLAEGEYHNGKQIGVATAWHENGQKRIVENFKDGVRDGLSTAWYSDGTKQGEGEFKHGKEEGFWTWWHPNSKKAVRGEFRSGRRFGVWTYWNPDGSFKATEDYALESSKPTPTK